jgi:hypothetical protein
MSYNDFVTVDPSGKQVGDFIWTLSPSILIRTEGPENRTVSLAYVPAFVYYLDHSSFDTIDHLATASVLWPLNRLTLGLHENVAIFTGVYQTVGNQASLTSYSTTGTAAYDLSDRTFLSASVSYVPTQYGGFAGAPYIGVATPGVGFPGTGYPGTGIAGGGFSGTGFSGMGYPGGYGGFGTGLPVGFVSNGQFISSDQYSEQLQLNYRYTPRLTFGGGASITEITISHGPTQLFEGPVLTASYVATALLSFNASTGWYFQQAQNSPSSTLIPYFTLGGSYHMRPGTTLSLTGNRSEQPSGILPGENYTQTGINATLSQKLWPRTSLSLNGSYSYSEYISGGSSGLTKSTDSYYGVGATFSWAVAAHWSTGVFFQHSGSSSSTGSYGFDQNTIGLQAGWNF